MGRDRMARLLTAGVLMMSGAGCGEISGGDEPRRAGLTGGWRTAGCEFSRSPQYRVADGMRRPVTPARLGAAMERVDRGGRERFRDSYAGLELDRGRVRAIVYRVPSAAFDDFIRHSAQDSCIVVRDTAHSVAELTGWHDRIVADLPYWVSQGVRIGTVGSRHDGVGVQIGTRDVARARRTLPARYGPEAPLLVIEENPMPVTP